MRQLWSEARKRRLWRHVWIALAQAQCAAGLVTEAQLADLQAHADDIDIEAAEAKEKEIHHDLMAELLTFADQCPQGGGILHLGATSMDIEDNADALRLREAADLLLARLREVLDVFAEQIVRWSEHPCLAFTHLQPAEVTTVGHRLATYGQDLLSDWHDLQQVRDNIRGKGFRGAVGTAASYGELLHNTSLSPAEMESRAMAALNLEPFPVVTQTYPRKQDTRILHALANLAQSVHRFAADLRILQSPAFGEWAEPFGKRQVGSSAMPFKRNPITAEKIDSLARFVAAQTAVPWGNAALSFLERTLDDSANRRLVLPQTFLVCDELLTATKKLITGLRVDEEAIARNLSNFGAFAATERVLMAVARQGADRQKMHEIIRQHSLSAWAAVQQGDLNPLAENLSGDEEITRYLAEDQVRSLMDASEYVGRAPAYALALAGNIRDAIGEDSEP